MQLSGALPSLVTPMSAPGALDLAGLAAMVERVAEVGAIGVVVCGTAGEGTLLSAADRRSVTAAAVAGGVPVIAGASGATLDELHADVARLAGTGASAVLVQAPSYQPLTADELVTVHLEVAKQADVPTVVSHVPQLTGSALTPATVTRLAEHRNILAIKDASPDQARRARFVTAGGSRLPVLAAHLPTLGAALRAGATGSITAIANVRMAAVLALHAAAQADDDAEVARLQASLTAAEAGLQSVGTSMPAALKAAMQLEGLIDERYCVPPLASVDGRRLDLVRTALLR